MARSRALPHAGGNNRRSLGSTGRAARRARARQRHHASIMMGSSGRAAAGPLPVESLATARRWTLPPSDDRSHPDEGRPHLPPSARGRGSVTAASAAQTSTTGAQAAPALPYDAGGPPGVPRALPDLWSRLSRSVRLWKAVTSRRSFRTGRSAPLFGPPPPRLSSPPELSQVERAWIGPGRSRRLCGSSLKSLDLGKDCEGNLLGLLRAQVQPDRAVEGSTLLFGRREAQVA